MAVKKSELYSSLWASCDALRGGMDASQYKDYILTLLFVKYVSDKFTGEDYADIDVPEGGSFDDMVKLIGKKNIGEGINTIIGKLAESNNLHGIIDKVSFNDSDKLGKGDEMVKKLSKLIEIFRRPDLDFSKNRVEDDDLIGDAYEYLMQKFATESGKSKGQFYTPAEVSRILAKVVGLSRVTNTSATIYDPACGSGSLLIRALNEAPIALSGYGQEKDTATAGLAQMNAVLHDWATTKIKAGNTFSDPRYFEEGSDETVLQRFDYIVANPPFSIKNWTDGVKEYGRFNVYREKPPEKNGDYAWLLHILKSLKRTGKAAVILPHGVLFRGNAEGEIRKDLIKTGYIKGIIGLPANLFYGTSIPACIIIIDKEDADERAGIFMIDASRDFVKDGNKNRLRERDVYKIVTTFNEQITTDPHYARYVPMSEIKDKNGYNLNISRYIDSGIDEDLQNIEAHLKGGIPAADVDSMERYWSVFSQLKSKLFSTLREGFYQLNVPKEEVRSVIHEDKEFSAYADKMDAAFMGWRSAVDEQLRNINVYVIAKELIGSLAEKILTQYEDIELIDRYDVYQVLLAYWQDIMSDDVYLLIYDGYEAGRELSYEYVVKTKTEGDETITIVTDKVKNWDGKLIPKQILTDMYFSEEKKAIDDISAIVADLQAQVDVFVEERSGEEGVLSDCYNAKDNLDAKLVAAKLKKLKADEPNGEEYGLLKQYRDLVEKIKEQNKLLKKLSAILEQHLKEKYAVLTLDEIKELMIDKKWYPSIFDGINKLYISISHNIADRIVALAERYEDTLPALSSLVEEHEARIGSHLERMGFVW